MIMYDDDCDDDDDVSKNDKLSLSVPVVRYCTVPVQIKILFSNELSHIVRLLYSRTVPVLYRTVQEESKNLSDEIFLFFQK